MALSFVDALALSIFTGLFFGLMIGVKYLVRIEGQQKKVFEKVLKIEELILVSEKKILSTLSRKKN